MRSRARMNPGVIISCVLMLILGAEDAVSAEDPSHASHGEQQTEQPTPPPRGQGGHEHEESEANAEAMASERRHVAPDLPQHPMHNMSSAHMFELMQMESSGADGSIQEPCPPVDVAGRTAIVVDDGIATGGTVLVALRAIRKAAPARIVLAIPVAPSDTLTKLSAEADEIVCLEAPSDFRAVGVHYADFTQTSDDEVIELLARQRVDVPGASVVH